eukprot:m.369968 g.369968  ORF g.369968 m.369968 type:complete len:209 (+) comp16680_c1_seq29:2312-2938(+)
MHRRALCECLRLVCGGQGWVRFGQRENSAVQRQSRWQCGEQFERVNRLASVEKCGIDGIRYYSGPSFVVQQENAVRLRPRHRFVHSIEHSAEWNRLELVPHQCLELHQCTWCGNRYFFNLALGVAGKGRSHRHFDGSVCHPAPVTTETRPRFLTPSLGCTSGHESPTNNFIDLVVTTSPCRNEPAGRHFQTHLLSLAWLLQKEKIVGG